MMRILMLTAYFPPDTGSASHLFYELGTALAKRGHKVTVITTMPSYHAQGSLQEYKKRLWVREAISGMSVVRVLALRLPRHIMVGRAIWQFGGAAMILLSGLLQKRHDVTLVYSPPLPLGLAAWVLHKLRGTPFLLNVQDLFPQSILDLNLVRNRWLIQMFESMERFLYRRAPYVTVHSIGNKHHVVDKGGNPEQVGVLCNWVDTNYLRPGERSNSFRRQWNLGNEFIVSFAGILGYSQDLDVVLEAAHRINFSTPICFLIVGDGVEKSRLEVKARQMKLSNVRFIPMQSREQYPAVLHASDVCLVTLRRQVKTPVVPSKIMSAMAAERPVVAALDLSGDTPKLIQEAGCGLVVGPEDPEALAEAVLGLYRDRSLCQRMGRLGRMYAEEHFSLEAAAARYEKELRKLTT